MLLATRQSFDYVKCSVCGSIQIVAIPSDLERYYPQSYRHVVRKSGRLGRMLRRQRGAYADERAETFSVVWYSGSAGPNGSTG